MGLFWSYLVVSKVSETSLKIVLKLSQLSQICPKFLSRVLWIMQSRPKKFPRNYLYLCLFVASDLKSIWNFSNANYGPLSVQIFSRPNLCAGSKTSAGVIHRATFPSPPPPPMLHLPEEARLRQNHWMWMWREWFEALGQKDFQPCHHQNLKLSQQGGRQENKVWSKHIYVYWLKPSCG